MFILKHRQLHRIRFEGLKSCARQVQSTLSVKLLVVIECLFMQSAYSFPSANTYHG